MRVDDCGTPRSVVFERTADKYAASQMHGGAPCVYVQITRGDEPIVVREAERLAIVWRKIAVVQVLPRLAEVVVQAVVRAHHLEVAEM